MNNLILFIAIAFGIVWVIGTSLGFDLAIKRNWLYILSGFLAGTLIGIANSDLVTGVVAGLFLSIAAILGGPFMLKKRRGFRE
jgi:hypothetical protein